MRIVSLFMALVAATFMMYGSSHASIASANMLIKAPSSCGTAPLGDAAADVSAAGFSTCARYTDWTTSRGSLSNWLDCSGSSTTAPNAQWTWFTNDSPCTVVSQATDPSTGGLALHIAMGPSATWFYEMGTGPQGGDFNPATYANKNWTYPMGVYIQYTMRDTSPYISSYNDEVNFWTYNLSTYGSGDTGVGTCGGGNNWQYGDYLEIDFNETTTLPGTAGYTSHNWPCNGTGNQNGPYNYSFTLSNYNTYGYLLTNDGKSTYSMCVYMNGTRQFCKISTTPDSAGEILGRMTLQFTESYNDCNATSCPNSFDTYIKDFKVLTCGNWLSTSGAAQACSGTSFNGNFYTGA